ncbi:unnamed protein product [Ilex paraguariensis]|uniref:Uncharacterized protein n=1 Tax=Ilex paraguariensis TaxID=185542 RepID=A0ABC8V5J1_9AQUA
MVLAATAWIITPWWSGTWSTTMVDGQLNMTIEGTIKVPKLPEMVIRVVGQWANQEIRVGVRGQAVAWIETAPAPQLLITRSLAGMPERPGMNASLLLEVPVYVPAAMPSWCRDRIIRVDGWVAAALCFLLIRANCRIEECEEDERGKRKPSKKLIDFEPRLAVNSPVSILNWLSKSRFILQD